MNYRITNIFIACLVVFVFTLSSVSAQVVPKYEIERVVQNVNTINNIHKSIEENQELQFEINLNYCVYKNSNIYGIENYFNDIMNENITLKKRRLAFLNNNYYCLDSIEMTKAIDYLETNLYQHDLFYSSLVSTYELKSKKPLLPPLSLKDIFDKISKERRVDQQNKIYLRDYATLCNLNEFDEDVYLDHIIQLFKEDFEKAPDFINGFYNKYLRQSLQYLKSKKSIIATTDYFLADHVLEVNHKYNNFESSHNPDISISLAWSFIEFCIKPKIIQTGEFLLLIDDIDNNLADLREYIVSDKVIWKSEM